MAIEIDNNLEKIILALLSHCEILPENKEKIEKSRNDDDDDDEMRTTLTDRQTRDGMWSHR